MQLTTKKLESLIQEMMGRRRSNKKQPIGVFSEQPYQEREKKILALIKKCRNLFFELQVVQGFFPTIINSVYSYDDTEAAIKDMTAGPLGKKAVKKHYRAIQKIVEILEEVNQYLFLLETLEIEGNIAFIAKGMIYGGLSGPITATGHRVKLEELADMVDTGIFFLEDVQEAVPGSLGKGSLDLQTMRKIAKSFDVNYSDLKDYLDSV